MKNKILNKNDVELLISILIDYISIGRMPMVSKNRKRGILTKLFILSELIDKPVSTTNEEPKNGKICTGGTCGNIVCPKKGQYVEDCDDGCAYPGA